MWNLFQVKTTPSDLNFLTSSVKILIPISLWFIPAFWKGLLFKILALLSCFWRYLQGNENKSKNTSFCKSFKGVVRIFVNSACFFVNSVFHVSLTTSFSPLRFCRNHCHFCIFGVIIVNLSYSPKPLPFLSKVIIVILASNLCSMSILRLFRHQRTPPSLLPSLPFSNRRKFHTSK